MASIERNGIVDEDTICICSIISVSPYPDRLVFVEGKGAVRLFMFQEVGFEFGEHGIKPHAKRNEEELLEALVGLGFDELLSFGQAGDDRLIGRHGVRLAIDASHEGYLPFNPSSVRLSSCLNQARFSQECRLRLILSPEIEKALGLHDSEGFLERFGFYFEITLQSLRPFDLVLLSGRNGEVIESGKIPLQGADFFERYAGVKTGC